MMRHRSRILMQCLLSATLGVMIACMPHQALASGETGAPQYADYADHADDPEQLAADEMSRLSAGNPVTITPVISMDKETFEYAADLEIYPTAAIQMEGCIIGPGETGEDPEVMVDGESIGHVETYFTYAEDMPDFRILLNSGIDENHVFEMPDEADDMTVDITEASAGSYSAISVFISDQYADVSYADTISEPASFEIVPAKLRISAGMDLETVKYKTIDDAADSIWWDSIVCERMNLPNPEDVDDVNMFDVVETADYSNLKVLIDGSPVSKEEKLLQTGLHTFKFDGYLVPAEAFSDKYVFSEYAFDENRLTVYSDADLSVKLKKGRTIYYGAPLSEIPSLYDHTYKPGADGTELNYDTIRFKLAKDRYMKEVYSSDEVPFIAAETDVYARAYAENVNNETVASPVMPMKIQKRPVSAKAPDHVVERANPLKEDEDSDFPYQTKFTWEEAGFTFKGLEEFETDVSESRREKKIETWTLSYAGEPLSAGKLFASDGFTVYTSYYYIKPYVPGKYVSDWIDKYKSTEFMKTNISLDEVYFAYEILPKYYYTYVVDGQVVGEYSSPAGKPDESVTYALKSDSVFPVQDGRGIAGWNFYNSVTSRQIAADDGSFKASTCESGMDGTYSFTDRDVIADAWMVTRTQGVEISDISVAEYDGRAHVLSSMPADGRKTVADLDFFIADGDYRLIYGEDYTARVSNNVNASLYQEKPVADNKKPRVVITGKGDYKGLKETILFDIKPCDISGFSYTMDGLLYADRSGKVHIGKRTISGYFTDGRPVTLKASDYREWTDDPIPTKLVGDDYLSSVYDLYAYGRGNYTGYVSQRIDSMEWYPISFDTFKVKYNATINYKESITADDLNVRVFTPKGKPVDPTDYTVSLDTAADGAASSGFLKVVITPKSYLEYGGEDDELVGDKTIYVKIRGEKLAKNRFKLEWIKADYSGADTPNSVICSDESLKEGRDYSLEWSEDCNAKNKEVGLYSVTIRGMGKYANLDKNGNPASIKLTFKRNAVKASKAGSSVTVSKDEASSADNGATLQVSVIVKNADGSQTTYSNRLRKGIWGRSLVSEDGQPGFTVTSWGKPKNGSRTVTIKCLSTSGFSGAFKIS